MTRRRLHFDTFDEVTDDIDRLHTGGYRRAGNWDLAQICDHLTAVMRMSLDGLPGPITAAWPLRLFGPTLVKWTTLWTGRMPAGLKSPSPLLLPTEPRPEATAVAHCIATMREVRDHEGDFEPSPLMGKLTPQQWRRIHLIHAAHHLSFLVPKG